jgi:HSP20 family protein
MRLPAEVSTEAVKADMSEGVLTITVPKAETTKPRHVQITERSGGQGGQGQSQGGQAQSQGNQSQGGRSG